LQDARGQPGLLTSLSGEVIAALRISVVLVF